MPVKTAMDRKATIQALRAAAQTLARKVEKKNNSTRIVRASRDGQVFVGLAMSPTVGAWITPATDVDDLSEQIGQVLQKAKRVEPNHGDEWVIADYSDFPDLGENPNLEDLAAVAEALEEHGPKIVAAALDWAGGDVADALTLLENGYSVYDSEEDFAQQYVDEVGIKEIPNIDWYVDFEKLGRDLLSDASTAEVGNKIVVWG